MEALVIEDVDIERGVIHVRRALVVDEYKGAKERPRARMVELIDPAIGLLKLILLDAAEAPHQAITVVQRDNVSTKRNGYVFCSVPRQRALPGPVATSAAGLPII